MSYWIIGGLILISPVILLWIWEIIVLLFEGLIIPLVSFLCTSIFAAMLLWFCIFAYLFRGTKKWMMK